MSLVLTEWLQFLVRWIHLIAGISWIGNSFYFMWLDSTIIQSPPADKSKTHIEGELWMTHGGGFYFVEKRKMRPGELPAVLHWFKWEATFTWISGFSLLAIVYYLGSSVYLVNPAFALSPGGAVLLSLGLLVGSWFVYDFLWQSKLAQKSKTLTTIISLGLVSALAYGLCQVFSGRGAFIHLGAIFGTIMVLNVWIRILPAQRRMIQATERGEIPDYEEGKKAKWRSTHNSYVTLPVLFTMISNHIPLAYGNPYGWIILLLLCIVGGFIRHMMMSWNYNKSGVGALVPALVVLAIIVALTSFPWKKNGANSSGHSSGPVTFHAVRSIIQNRCTSCHSAHPTDDTFVAAPNGVMFDDASLIKKYAERIKFRSLTTKTMPFANKTAITEEERSILGQWVDQGATVTE